MIADPVAYFESLVGENREFFDNETTKSFEFKEIVPERSSSLLNYSADVQFSYERKVDLTDLFNDLVCSGTVPFISLLHGRQYIKLHDATLSYDDVAPLLFEQKNRVEMDSKRAGRPVPNIVALYNHGGKKDSTAPSMATIILRAGPELTANVILTQSFTERHRDVKAKTVLSNLKTRKRYSLASFSQEKEAAVTYVFGVPDKSFSEDVLIHLITVDPVISPFFAVSEVTSGAMNVSGTKIVSPVFFYMGGSEPVAFKIKRGDLVHEAEEGQDPFPDDTMFTTFSVEAPNYQMVEEAKKNICRLLAHYDAKKDAVPKLYKDNEDAMKAKVNKPLGRSNQAASDFATRNAQLPPQVFRAPPKRNSRMTYARACQNPPRIVPAPPEGYDEDKYLRFPDEVTAGVEPQWYSCDHYAKDYVDPNAPKKKPKKAPAKPTVVAVSESESESESEPEPELQPPKTQPKTQPKKTQAVKGLVFEKNHTAFDPVSGLTYTIHDVEGDGNCFFRAVALAEEAEEPDAHLQYRKDIVRGMMDLQQNDEEAKEVLVRDSSEKQLDFQTLLKPGVWDVEEMDYVPAFTNKIIGRTVKIYSSDKPPIEYEVEGTYPIYLIHVNRDHYKVLTPM